MSSHLLTADAVRRALSIRDLTDPASGPHAMQTLVSSMTSALVSAWGCTLNLCRGSPIVSVADNYDHLHYPPDGAARDARYTRYVCDTAVLRTQTSAMIPGILRRMSHSIHADALIACPGLVYRRDCIDRLHTGEPHQMDLWRIRSTRQLSSCDLLDMVECVVHAALPGREWRTSATEHPYTVGGLQIDVRDGNDWVEIGECGLALPALLAEHGLAEPWSGLAMGLGLDRLLMLRKGIPDIRLLRSDDQRIATQMRDLEPYWPVSTMPAVTRDLSIAVSQASNAEALGDAVRLAIGDRSIWVERVAVLSETPYAELPQAARERIGMNPDQKNVLVRVVLRALDRTLTTASCNQVRDDIYTALHQGSSGQWVTRPSCMGNNDSSWSTTHSGHQRTPDAVVVALHDDAHGGGSDA